MKRVCTILLAAALAASLALPAAAADSADQRLTRVTQAVKETLGLDTADYDQFSGDCYEQELAPVWTLRWSGQAGTLTVEALEDGTIVSYRLGDPGIMPLGTDGSFPAFPGGDPEAAAAAARAFLARVLDGKTESVQLGEPYGLDQLDSTGYTFSGILLLNGLPSPLTYSLTVRAGDNQVTRFRREAPETAFLGDIPAAAPAVSQAQAAAGLKGTLGLRLEYVLPEADSTHAVLRYLPEGGHAFYVDARTGALVDLTALEEAAFGGGRGYKVNAAADTPTATAEGAADLGALSQAEQAGIQKLEGVLPSGQLDSRVRAEAAYGLGRYTLVSAAYALEQAEAEGGEDTVLCTLRYSRTDGDDVRSRTVTVDARTGQVERVFSSAPWGEAGKAPKLSLSQAQAKAEAFLKTFAGARYQGLALYDTADRTGDGAPFYTFTFARKVNGAFFPGQTYTVGIDGGDGSVYRLSWAYPEDVTFDAADGVLTPQAALDAWMDTYTVTLGYRLVPEQLNGADPAQARLLEQGMTHFYALRLSYGLEREDPIQGLDAKTGQVLRPEDRTRPPAYGDLAGSWAKADIETLAQYGVGYDAEAFQPGKTLTQWDLVCLLASLRGLRLDPAAADAQARDEAYAIAYALGALDRADRDDGAVLTRGQVVKLLLNGAGYGPVARLKGIFTCSYTDRSSIPAGDLGYAALAQGLGMVRGTYAGSRAACRAEAAVMLCRLLARPR